MTPFGLRLDRFEIGVRNRVHPLFDFPGPGFEQAKVSGGQRISLGRSPALRRLTYARRQSENCLADVQHNQQPLTHLMPLSVVMFLPQPMMSNHSLTRSLILIG